ncbi:hypothetical protein NMY22_g12435 [Coprinellus aureogranulatus]|nr:hypothetical protein NMY22_g12435 [Coprinellus aureogranulatus]
MSNIVDIKDYKYVYPGSLVDSARNAELNSPKKGTRKVTQPAKPRPKSAKRPGRGRASATGGKNGIFSSSAPTSDSQQGAGIPSSPVANSDCASGDGGQADSENLEGVQTAFGQGGIGQEDETDFGHAHAVSSPEKINPGSMSAITESQLSTYVDAVDCLAVVFTHIGDKTFVVEGWSIEKECGTGSWYHLQYLWRAQGELHIGCTCPQGMRSSGIECMHKRFFSDYQVEKLYEQDSNLTGALSMDNGVAIFRRQSLSLNEHITLFSVKSASRAELTGRAIVTHTGEHLSSASGKWRCSKDARNTMCAHIAASFSTLKSLLGEGSLEDCAAIITAEPLATISQHSSVSHLPILPPLSFALSSDFPHYPRPRPFRDAPNGPILLDKFSSCSSCQLPLGRTYRTPDGVIVYRKCHIYTLTNVFTADIQLQRCPKCPASRRRFIGPDLREAGLFNYNNSIVVSHEVLDEYTVMYAHSETPFTSFVSLLSHRYSMSGDSFMGEDLFRSVWFAYVSLQAFENDMRCSFCGPHPETIIWDGVTLAFSRKHISSTLAPPTLTSPAHSSTRPLVQNHPRQQLLIDASLRKQVRLVLKGITIPVDDTPAIEDASIHDTNKSLESKQRQLLQIHEHVERINSVHSRLRHLCEGLAQLFLQHYGYSALQCGKKVPSPIKNFFLQVAAEESVLQMVNASSLNDLRHYLADPKFDNVSFLCSIPGLFQVANIADSLSTLIPVMKWIQERVETVLKELEDKGEYPPTALYIPPDDWRLTGCFYSFPQIRYRPVYPKLKTDKKQESQAAKRGDLCGKFYAQYGERRLTGGIMVAWCRHSVCYGFHCIPEAEGRNDVFSAMFTRWPVAPKRVIYDYACALGPYCMIREPEFFKHTFFAIDHFHAEGHTKCSSAAFLSEYANADPALVSINSSAAECGNSGLRRIRKSVSYMAQERAIIYTKVFLSSWNRIPLLYKILVLAQTKDLCSAGIQSALPVMRSQSASSPNRHPRFNVQRQHRPPASIQPSIAALSSYPAVWLDLALVAQQPSRSPPSLCRRIKCPSRSRTRLPAAHCAVPPDSLVCTTHPVRPAHHPIHVVKPAPPFAPRQTARQALQTAVELYSSRQPEGLLNVLPSLQQAC